MEKPELEMNVSDVRSKLTHLEKILKPGESLGITRRGKSYARIELIEKTDIDNEYDIVLDLIEALPEATKKQRSVAEDYKSILYGKKDANAKRV